MAGAVGGGRNPLLEDLVMFPARKLHPLGQCFLIGKAVLVSTRGVVAALSEGS